MKVKYLLWLLLLTGSLKAQEGSTFEYALIEASRQKLIGNLTEAIRLYKGCLEIEPESGAVNYELGSIFMALEEETAALEYLESAYISDPSNYWYLLAYSEALKLNGMSKEAIGVLKKAIKNDQNIRLEISLAENFRLIGKSKSALRILEDIEERYGLSEFLVIQKADIYKELGDIESGEKELNKLIQVMPESAEVYILAAEYMEEGGSMETAIVYYKRALEIDSMNIFALTNLADHYNSKGEYSSGLAYLKRAFLLEEIQVEKKVNALMYFFSEDQLFTDNAKQIEALIKVLSDQYPDNISVLTLAYDFYRKQEDSLNAYIVINNILNIKKDNYVFWQQAVYTASVVEKYDDIIRLVEEAKDVFPGKTDLDIFLGLAYLQKEDFDKSYAILKAIYKPGDISGYNLQVLTFLAESAYKKGMNQSAFQYFESILEVEENNYVVMNNYAYYLSLEDTLLERAKELSYKTIIQYPDNPVYLDTYAWILYKMGYYPEALEYIEKAYSNEKEDADVLFHYSEILRMNGMEDKALIYLEKSQAAGYDEDEIKRIKNELEE